MTVEIVCLLLRVIFHRFSQLLPAGASGLLLFVPRFFSDVSYLWFLAVLRAPSPGLFDVGVFSTLVVRCRI